MFRWAPVQLDDWRSAAQLRESVRAEILAQCGEPDLAGTRP
jgi:hypothetical protein